MYQWRWGMGFQYLVVSNAARPIYSAGAAFCVEATAKRTASLRCSSSTICLRRSVVIRSRCCKERKFGFIQSPHSLRAF